MTGVEAIGKVLAAWSNAPLFPDIPEALRHMNNAGIKVSTGWVAGFPALRALVQPLYNAVPMHLAHSPRLVPPVVQVATTAPAL